ncbi:Dos2-interacting transcription regulator of RNA-Pol-II [Carpediemonas membranifera]|uniref:MMS19 nucleotide excision repair protein n=1 Tax=Carpediemonas membranifera TaxID=201153 RepID=A0A8J6E498_9EUKA|nr:Dos2-interacting transcription regulator of RNA-Pol-II [Carpediemonas membranifera]|eukprot:KAG9396641.1 Dos2-interacting transcription regulator of RNA-Pol-II [Carpediemonas membranifera]
MTIGASMDLGKYIAELTTEFKDANDTKKTELSREALSKVDEAEEIAISFTDVVHFTSFIDQYIRQRPLAMNLLKLSCTLCERFFSSFTTKQLIVLLRTVIKHVRIQYQPSSVRAPIMHLISRVASTIEAPCAQSLELIDLCVSAGQGEKAPQSLLLFFQTLSRLIAVVEATIDMEDGVSEDDLMSSLQDVFDDLALYYPLSYEPVPDDPHPLPRETLLDAYNNVLFGSGHITQLSVPFIIDHMALAKEKDKIACFLDVEHVIARHGLAPIAQFTRDLWWETVQEACHGSALTKKAALSCLGKVLDVDPVTGDQLTEYCRREYRFDSGSQQAAAGVLDLGVVAAKSARASTLAPPLLVALFRRLFMAWEQSQTKEGQDHVIWVNGAARILAALSGRVSGMDRALQQATDDVEQPKSPRPCDAIHPIAAMLVATLAVVSDKPAPSESDVAAVAVRLVRTWFDIVGGVGAVTDDIISTVATGLNRPQEGFIPALISDLIAQVEARPFPSLAALIEDPVTGPALALLRHLHQHPTAPARCPAALPESPSVSDVALVYARCGTDDELLALVRCAVPDLTHSLMLETALFALSKIHGSVPSETTTALIKAMPLLAEDRAVVLASTLRPRVAESPELPTLVKLIDEADVRTLAVLSAAQRDETAPTPAPAAVSSAQAAVPALIVLAHDEHALADRAAEVIHGIALTGAGGDTVCLATRTLSAFLTPDRADWLAEVLGLALADAMEAIEPSDALSGLILCAVTLVESRASALNQTTLRTILGTLTRMIGFGPISAGSLIASRVRDMVGNGVDNKLLIELAGQLLGLEGQVYGKPERQSAVLVALAGLLSTVPDAAIPVVCKLRGGEAVYAMLGGIGHHGDIEVAPEVAEQCARALARIATMSAATMATTVQAVVTESLESVATAACGDDSYDQLLVALMRLLYACADIAAMGDTKDDLKRLVTFRLRPALAHPRRAMRQESRRARGKWYLV